MTDHHETVGAIRRACYAISDFYDMALIPPRLTSGVKLPTEASGDAKMKYAAKVFEHSPPPANLDVIDARRKAHMDLLHYTRIIQFEVTDINGGTIQTTIDGGNIRQMCEFIERWAERLVKEAPAEAEQAAEDLASHGRALRRYALPDRAGSMLIGDCPVSVARDGSAEPCGTALRAYPDEDGVHRFVACPGCGTEDTLHWWMSQIVPEASELAPASTVIASVASRTHRLLTSNLIRQWAHLGHIQRHGKDLKGRTLYSVQAVLAYATDGTKEEAA